MGLFNKKIKPITGVIAPNDLKRDAMGKFFDPTKNREANQEQRLVALEQRVEVLQSKIETLKADKTGGCKCGTKGPEVKSPTKAKPKK